VTAAPGSMGEEAAKLVDALSEWARSAAGGELPLATGSTECTLCPVCQLLTVMRRARPETFTHLAEATTSLIAAMRTVVETHEHHNGHGHGHGHGHGGNGAGHAGVQRIDLDVDGPQ